MNAKCSKCGETNFSIVKSEYGYNAYRSVICSKCGTIAGVLPDANINDNQNIIIKNQGVLDNRFNVLEEKIKQISGSNEQIFNMIQHIVTK